MSTRHVTNGDHAAGKLRRFGDGPVTVACDVLHEGPCPPLEGDAWHAAAAAKLVLWFEHDLFDQLILIRTLNLLRPASADVRLICIGAFPAVDRFIGLGQLTVEQLATLDGTGAPVTADHYAIAADAWSAFRSPDPPDLLAVAKNPDAGRADHVRLNGIDRWRGGVHLTSAGSGAWRWDSRRETLVR